jgi:hypothetical protein
MMTTVSVLMAAPFAVAIAYPTVNLTHHDIIPGMSATHIIAPRGFFNTLAAMHGAWSKTPAFSRQTKLPCSSCHYQFPQLTPFGRTFKLNGYTLTGLTTIGEPTDTAGGRTDLKLAPFPPVAAMIVGSLTHTSTAQPTTQNSTALFPQEASIFLTGQITPNIGAFTQFTYSGADGTIGIDNVDVRYATHTTMGDRDMLWGVTLHNNPTVQDVWNTTPAWGYPFMASEVAPSPIASTMIDGGLAQQVLGLGVYSLFNNVLYAEATAYRSALQGARQPLDSTATNVTNGVIPYWRLALQHSNSSTYMMVGTYGLSANLYPQGVSGKTNRYTDIGLDAQVEHSMGSATLIGRATYIHEQQHLDAFLDQQLAERVNPTLSTVRASIGLLPSQRYSFNLGYFQTTGTSDTLLFAPAALTGSRTGSPTTVGEMGEITYNAWENTRFSLQYILYNKFNGASTSYDIAGGRRASGNNTLYLYTWMAF